MALMNLARAPGRPTPSSELREALAACWHAFIAIGVMSGLINILYLTGSFYMLEIYDRVLPSRSVPTLVALSILALTLFTFQGVLDVIRSRVMVRIAASLDERLSSRVYDIVVQLPLRAKMPGDGLAPIRDLDQIRSFLIGTGPLALFDLPWMPFYLFICFLFHPWIGVAALVGAVILTSLTLLSEFMTRKPARSSMLHVGARNSLAEASRRNAEVIRAMGMAPRMGKVWGEANAKYLATQQQTSDVAGGLGAVSKVLRFALQSAVLGLGAYLVLQQQATAGVIIAASIIVARALAPVELAVANWRGFVAARQSWRRLSDLLIGTDPGAEPMTLPPPKGNLVVENVIGSPPGIQRLVVQDVEFHAQGRAGARHHRAERVRQVFARTSDCRRVGACARQGPARWRRARPVVAGRAWAAHRIPAAGCRVVRRNGRAEHRPLRAGGAFGSRHRRCSGRGRPRDDRALARGLRHADR